jgi:hypothetical protein
MGVEQKILDAFAKRVEDCFFDIDSDICVDLRDTDSGYSELWNETVELQRRFPVIPQFMESGGEVSLSAEEHAAIVRYLDVKHRMENAERRQLYLRGHRDGFAYLKTIGVV